MAALMALYATDGGLQIRARSAVVVLGALVDGLAVCESLALARVCGEGANSARFATVPRGEVTGSSTESP